MHRKLDSPIGKMATTAHTPLGAWNQKRVATLATCALAINCASLVRAQTSVTTDADTAHAEPFLPDSETLQTLLLPGPLPRPKANADRFLSDYRKG